MLGWWKMAMLKLVSFYYVPPITSQSCQNECDSTFHFPKLSYFSLETPHFHFTWNCWIVLLLIARKLVNTNIVHPYFSVAFLLIICHKCGYFVLSNAHISSKIGLFSKWKVESLSFEHVWEVIKRKFWEMSFFSIADFHPSPFDSWCAS